MFSGGDVNMMLAAVISVLVVLTFVILLHCYARWFLSQDYYNHHRTRHRIPPSPQITGFLHNPLSMLTIINTEIGDDRRRRPDNSPNKGLESSAISSIPQFVYKVDGEVPGLECIVCLSSFENEEKGRKLQLCEHSFHVECIDMWLHSHSTCPICRAPAVCAAAKDAIVVEDCDSTWSGSLEIV